MRQEVRLLRMPSRIRIDSRESPRPERHILGIDVSADCRRIRAAPLVASGNGLQTSVRVGRLVFLDLPCRVGELKSALDRSARTSNQDHFQALVDLRSILTEHIAIAAQESAVKSGSSLTEMLALGVSESGKTITTEDGRRDHLDLINPAQLANLTGANVISGFPERDLASGGNGGPLFPLPLWLLFRSTHRDRIFLHVGRVIRLCRLPRLTGSLSSVAGLDFVLSQGTALVDLLVRHLTNGEREFDPGGRLAVQGRRVDELIEHWLSQAETDSPPAEEDTLEMLRFAVAMAVERNWAVHDLLCSATHFVVELTVNAVERLARTSANTEVILAGGGLANGMILRHLTARLSDYPVRRIEELGGESDMVPAAVAAILALLHLDQVPANVSGLTGADTPRVLGNLTPGGPQAWQRLLASCVSGGHSIRPLRAAL